VGKSHRFLFRKISFFSVSLLLAFLP